MKIEAGEISRHGRAEGALPARLAAIEILLARGRMYHDKRGKLYLREKSGRGKEQSVPVTIHPTKGLLRQENRRTVSPVALLNALNARQ